MKTAALLRTGYTTGSCAAAAAKAAAMLLIAGERPSDVEIPFPDGSRETLPVARVRGTATGAEAAVAKDAGDDPDATHGSLICAHVEPTNESGIQFAAGEGVGTVTLPGLQVPPGEPAINPAPRAMIERAVREVTRTGLRVTLSIPGGAGIAQKTFNPRLGIRGGLSILGTSGRVRPFSAPALRASLVCGFDIAQACGITMPVLAPGHVGEHAARRHFRLGEQQVIPVSNEWGFMLDEAAKRMFDALLLIGHPGKMAKLVDGAWDTHSSRSPGAAPIILRLAAAHGIAADSSIATVDGIFEKLTAAARATLGSATAKAVGAAVCRRIPNIPLAVALVNMRGELLGKDGNTQPWE